MERPESDPIPLRYEFVVDREYRRRASVALYVRLALRRPTIWIAVSATLLVLAEGLLAHWSVGWIVLLAVMIVILVAIPLSFWVSISSQLRRNLKDGSVLRSGFGENAYRVSVPAGDMTIPLARIASVERRGPLVWVLLQNPRQRFLYPRELFPVGEEPWVRPLSSADSPRPTPGTPA